MGRHRSMRKRGGSSGPLGALAASPAAERLAEAGIDVPRITAGLCGARRASRHLGSSGTVNLGKAAPARPFGRAPGAGIVVDTLAAGLRDGVALQIEALAGR